MKTIHPAHLEHRFCIFGCQILCISDFAIMPLHSLLVQTYAHVMLPVCIHRVVGALVRLGVHLHHVGEQELVGVELGEVSAGQEGRVLVEVAPMC